MAIAKHKSRRSELRESRVLARRVQRGDRRAFELLYASYEGGLFRVAHRLTGSSEQAAALVEATFSRALSTLPEGGLDSVDIGAHLFGTARSLSYERNGSRNGYANGNGHANGNGNGNGNGHANGHANGNGHPGGTTPIRAAGEHAREVVAANARLAPRQRLALALRDLEGRPDDEIALALGTEGPSVPALVARARLRLREELALPTGNAACGGHLAELSAYADGTLPAAARAALETHLEECADCRAALFALREASQRYRAVPVPVPPGELSSRMAAALGAVGLPERTAPAAPAPVEPPAPEPVAAPAPAPLPGPPVPPRAGAVARGGRRSAAAIAMAVLVLIGIAITLVARDGGGSKPAARATPAAPAAAAGTGALPPVALTEVGAPLLVASAAGGRVPLAPPRKLRHARSGTRVFPHRSIPVTPARTAVVARSSSRPASTRTRTTAAASSSAAAKPPAKPVATDPKPIPAPEARRKIAVQILPPTKPPPTATPASATPPSSGSSPASDQTQTTST